MNPDRHQVIEETLAQGQAAADEADHQIAVRPERREVVRIAVIAAIVITLLGVAVSIGVSMLALSSSARTAAETEANSRDLAASQKLAQQAADAAQEANDTLRSRGQAPVPVPPPDPNDPIDTLTSAAAARVLAQLPEIRPSAAQLGGAVADYLIANPPGPSAGQISQALAGYFATNPPPSGPRGPRGDTGTTGQDGANGADGQPGAAPSAADIQAAFVDYVKTHPQFLPDELCASFGDNFAEAKTLVSSDGTQYSLFGCITEIIPGPAPPTPTE